MHRSLLAAAVLATTLSAQTVTTVVNNGPVTQLYDIVILGDGYRAVEQTRFDADVQSVVNAFRAQASLFPYNAYFHCYNVHSVFRASVESGADRPPQNIFRNTVYNASYWTGGTDRCLYIGNTAQAAADAALAPDSDGRVIVLVNDSMYGGCAGTFSVSYNGTSMTEVQAHEWGHSFGTLADEYADLTGMYPGPEPSSANCTLNPAGTKWAPWLGFAGQYGTVGAYPGASRYPIGIYRPEPNCEMRALSLRFCTICREQMIKRFNVECTMLVNPSPATPVAATQHTTRTFSFLNRLASRPHRIEWRVDAGPFLAGTNVWDWALGNTTAGAHTVTARLTDTSTEVRNDPGSTLVHTHTWTVNVAAGTPPRTGDIPEILPFGAATTEANSSTTFPWGSSAGMRTMQAYGRSVLGHDGPVRIHGLAFRPDGGTANLTAVAYQLSLTLSTARNPARALSYTFDQNHGADRLEVFNGTVTIPALALGGASPSQFALRIPFDEPFDWDAALGPLLVDIRYRGVVSGTVVAGWDGGLATGEDIGRIAHTGDADATTANFPGGSGNPTQDFALVTQLDLECLTVPSTLAAVEGNSGGALPWSHPSGPMRIQYVYDGTTFAPAERGQQRITRLAFRPDLGGAIPSRTYDLRVTLSTGAIGLSNVLSSTFDLNHGTDRTVVFDGTFTNPAVAAQAGPAGFDLELELTRGFDFNPNRGSLVVDLQLYHVTGAAGALFDGSSLVAAGHGQVANLTSATAPTGTTQAFALAMAVGSVPSPVLPESADGLEAASNATLPWGAATTTRTLHAYPGSMLGVSQTQFITHLRWRLEGGGAPFGPLQYDCAIDLSTGVLAPGALSPTFDLNHGANRVRVHDGPLSATRVGTASTPGAWVLQCQLSTPFRWRPADGPLVVDIRRRANLAGGPVAAFDSSNGAGGGRIAHSSDANAAVGNVGPDGDVLVLDLNGTGCNGQTVPFGISCAGATPAPPVIGTRSLPFIPNPDFAFTVDHAPANAIGFLFLGFSRVAIPVPGAAGCSIYSLGDLFIGASAVDAAGNGRFPLAVPNDRNLAGLRIVSQWILYQPGISPVDVITTGGLEYQHCY